MEEGMERFKLITKDDIIEHYDWADLDNPYNFGNVFTTAASQIGFKFHREKPTASNLLGIKADTETIDTMDEIGERLRMSGITNLYMAVDEGDIELINEEIEMMEKETSNGKTFTKPVYNLDFLRKSYRVAYERRVERLTHNPSETKSTSLENEQRYRQIKLRYQNQSFDYNDMTNQLRETISIMLSKAHYLKP